MRPLLSVLSTLTFVGSTFFLLSPSLAAAIVHAGTIAADEAQATTCAVGSTSEALGTVTYDDVSNLFTWTYVYGDNAPAFDDGGLFGGGSETISHFHGPALPGVGAGVQVGVGTGTPNSGSATITLSQGADLLAELWYLNVHSSSCGGGEIRGQVLFPPVVPSSSASSMTILALGLMGLSTLLLALRRRQAAR